MTRHSTLVLFIAGITGCIALPPAVETPANPPPGPKVVPPGASGPAATHETNGVAPLPPDEGERQKRDGAVPQLPEELRIPGRTYVVLAKICVSSAGAVDRVWIVKGNEPALAKNVVSTVKNWRYRPLTVNGVSPVPFCYMAKFEFKVN